MALSASKRAARRSEDAAAATTVTAEVAAAVTFSSVMEASVQPAMPLAMACFRVFV
jgi:hypothetical protein